MSKKYGQLFTSKETDVFMANLFAISEDNTTISILDPGAGSGILSVALLERIDTLSIKIVDLFAMKTTKDHSDTERQP